MLSILLPRSEILRGLLLVVGPLAGLALASPAIVTQPSAQAVAYGAYARLDVTASGTSPTYQWFEGAAGDTSCPVLGATSTTVLTRPVTTPVDYWVRIADASGSTDSAVATITPQTPLSGALSVAGGLRFSEAGESPDPYAPSHPIALASDFAAASSSGPFPRGHTLSLKTDGTLQAAGLNNYGQLGTGNTTFRTVPVTIASGVTRIATGLLHSLFLKADHTLWAMGYNGSGQLGDGTTTNRSTPIQVASDVDAIAVGTSFSLYRKTDGSLWRMGSGQSTLPHLKLAENVTSFAAGSSHFAFVKSDRTLWGAGSNTYGQLGTGNTTTISTPLQLASDVVAVAAHSAVSHTLFLTADGALYGMGGNDYGQLGTGDYVNRLSPVLIARNVTVIAAGGFHSAYVTADHSLWTLGIDIFGQLGLGQPSGPRNQSFRNQCRPQEAATRVVDVTASAYSTIFTTQTGDRFGMGLANEGQLGAMGRPSRSTPALMASGVRAIDASLFWTLYLTTDNRLWSSRGSELNGLPLPAAIAHDVARLIPTSAYPDTFAGSGASQAEAAWIIPRTVFVRVDGSLWGRGMNPAGQLGTGDLNDRSEPIRIADDVADAACTLDLTVFLKRDLTLWKTGTLSSSLGVISNPVRVVSPERLDDNVVSVKAAYYHVLYLKSDRTLWGIGDNYYCQIGGSSRLDPKPVTAPVLVASDVVDYAVGPRQSFFVKNDGSLWACGANSSGQLGASSSIFKAPFQLTTGVASVATAGDSTFVLKTNGSLWTTGDNTYGQLGNFTLTSQSTLGQVATNVAKLFPSINGESLLFFKTDGTLWGMGRNDLGQLGLGHARYVREPTLIRAQAYAVAASGLHTLVLHAPPSTVAAPAITTQPAAQTSTFGDFATLTVTATGDGVLTYQWYQGAPGDTSRPLFGAIAATLRLPAFAGTSGYWVRVANAAGSADSSAATITVTGAGSPTFRSWAEAAGLSGSRLSVSSDPDSDGLANLLEFAFGTPPAGAANAPGSPAFAPELVHLPDGDFLVLTHRHLKASVSSFSYERSSDLLTWETIPLTPAVTSPDADGDGLVEELSVSLPLPPDTPRQFLRVRVSSP